MAALSVTTSGAMAWRCICTAPEAEEARSTGSQGPSGAATALGAMTGTQDSPAPAEDAGAAVALGATAGAQATPEPAKDAASGTRESPGAAADEARSTGSQGPSGAATALGAMAGTQDSPAPAEDAGAAAALGATAGTQATPAPAADEMPEIRSSWSGNAPGERPRGKHQAGPGKLPGAATDSRRQRGEVREGCKAPAGSARTGAAGPKAMPGAAAVLTTSPLAVGVTRYRRNAMAPHQAGPGRLPGAATDSRRPRGEAREGYKAPAGSARTGAAGPKAMPGAAADLTASSHAMGVTRYCRSAMSPQASATQPDAAGPVRTRRRRPCHRLPPARGYGAASRVREVKPGRCCGPFSPAPTAAP